jgi:hypothetical protein
MVTYVQAWGSLFSAKQIIKAFYYTMMGHGRQGLSLFFYLFLLKSLCNPQLPEKSSAEKV